MIRQAMQNLQARHPLYAKALTNWLGEDLAHCKVWTNFKSCMYTQYERMLRAQGGEILEIYGYGGAFNAITSDDTAMLMETVVNYAEQSARKLAEVGELQAQLEAMAMQQQPRVENFPTTWYASHPHTNTVTLKSVASTCRSRKLPLEDPIQATSALTSNGHSRAKLANHPSNP